MQNDIALISRLYLKTKRSPLYFLPFAVLVKSMLDIQRDPTFFNNPLGVSIRYISVTCLLVRSTVNITKINITPKLGVIEISPGWLWGLKQSLRNFTLSTVLTFLVSCKN